MRYQKIIDNSFGRSPFQKGKKSTLKPNFNFETLNLIYVVLVMDVQENTQDKERETIKIQATYSPKTLMAIRISGVKR